MRQFLLISLLVGFVLGCKNPKTKSVSYEEKKKLNNDLIGTNYPPFSLITKQGKISTDSLKGKVVFLNFWFEGCPPCVAELDELNKLYDTFKYDKKFKFISFTLDPDERINNLKKKYKINYPLFSISEKDCQKLNFENGFPFSIILDTFTNIKYIHFAGFIDSAAVRKFMHQKIYPILRKELYQSCGQQGICAMPADTGNFSSITLPFFSSGLTLYQSAFAVSRKIRFFN